MASRLRDVHGLPDRLSESVSAMPISSNSIPFDRSLSLLLDETFALLQVATSPRVIAWLRAREEGLVQRITGDYSHPVASKRPDPETWEVIRKAILKRDHFRCCVCARNDVRVNVHHLIPVDKGGLTIPENLATLCDEHHLRHHPWLGEQDAP